MPKHELTIDMGDYAPVADRIILFYRRFPTGRILTRLVSRTSREITVQAFVYRSVNELRPSATGLAAERIGDGDVNTVACLENTETSAIGRALANLGLTASPHRPSREEMARSRTQLRRVKEPSPDRLTTQRSPPLDHPRQREADRVMDALDLLAQARRAGLSNRRAAVFRARLRAPAVAADMIERIERALRPWIAARHALRLHL